MEIEKITDKQSRVTFQDTDESLAVAYAVAELRQQTRVFQLPKAARKLTETISMAGIDNPESLSVDLSNRDAVFVIEALKNFSQTSARLRCDENARGFHYNNSNYYVDRVQAIVDALPDEETEPAKG
ncbi:MAG TPA: hypothetical protein VFM68_00320 [Candidatus Saccharimonadales bacterium]|nr:hypothetical protein [Candidatus Saccharimonadales bacterium]